ncbi:MAG: bifunctional ADP-dependent NAD(P)H-hydrate dehydratase/NAD(P)H-hydrate epimerase, partial [Rhodococcus sp. (in: high G+C Gram-positive bacteria)]
MRDYHPCDRVRAAEAPLLASLPDGTLMRRAAHGLARVVAAELRACTGGIAGRQVVLL